MKKIILSCVYGFVALILVAVIVLSVVQISTAPSIDAPLSVTLTVGGSEKASLQDDETSKSSYDAFFKAYNVCFSQNILSGIFGGHLSQNYGTKIARSSSNTNYTKSQLKSLLGSNYARFNMLGKRQTLLVGGAPVCVPGKATTTMEFVEVYFAIPESNGFSAQTYYLVNSTDTNGYITAYKITVYANFNSLYDYLEENVA